MNSHLLCLLLIATISGNTVAIKCSPTKGDEFCSCTGSGFTIDFRKILTLPITGIRDAFGTGAYVYQFDPCGLLTCVTSGAKNGIVCQNVEIGSNEAYYVAKNTEPPVWDVAQVNPLQFSVIYSGGDKTEGGSDPRERQALLVFQHVKDQNLDIAMTIEHPEGGYQQYRFLASAGTLVAERSSGIAVGVVGLVLMILLIVAVVVYFIVGATVNYVYRGARGAEVIPNYALWKDLPFLIKDGFLFLISPCYKRSQYEKF